MTIIDERQAILKELEAARQERIAAHEALAAVRRTHSATGRHLSQQEYSAIIARDERARARLLTLERKAGAAKQRIREANVLTFADRFVRAAEQLLPVETFETIRKAAHAGGDTA